MQTSPVLNTVAPAHAQANKQTDANPSADSFNQVLSKEVADRQNASEPPKTQETNAANSAKPTAGNAPAEAKAKDADKPSDDTDASAEDPSDATAVINDMLALVASFNHVRPPAPRPADASTETAAASTETAAVGTDTAAARIAPDTDLSRATRSVDAAAVPRDQASLKADANVAVDAKADTDTPSDAPAPTDTKFASNFAHALNKASGVEEASDKAAVKPADLSSAPPKPAQDLAAKVKDMNTISKAETKTEFAIDAKEAPAAVSVPPLQQTAQAVANNLPHPAAAQSSDRLAPQVGTTAWNNAFAQKVTWMVAGEQQSASLTLNPPDLGPLQVVLNVTNSQANATFIAAQPEVRQALEAAMPRLRDMLNDAGIQLGQANVSSGSPGQQGAPDQQSSQARRPDFSATRFDMPVQTERVQTVSLGLGRVDTFV